MGRVFTTGWELGHTGSSSSGTIHEADVTARLTGNMETVTNPARNGGRSLYIQPASDYLYAGMDVPAMDEFWLRWGFLYQQSGTKDRTNTILSWAGPGGVVGGIRYHGISLDMSLWSGSNKMNGGSSEVMLASESSGALKLNRWHLFEMHWKTDSAVGVVELRVDGTQVIIFNGNTDDGKGQVTQIRFGHVLDDLTPTTGPKLYYDDCALDDADWVGDGHVVLLKPNGNGNSSQLTGSDGDQIDNWQLVNETPAENGDYVEGDSPGLTDTYVLEDTVSADIPDNAEIKHVDVVALGRTLSVGADGLKGVVRTGGSDYPTPAQTLKSAFAPHRFGFPLNPDTGQSWTLSELDAAEAGIETA